ncbi:hypothetical protein WDW89_20935, partial [Deltaproteobacteria bacterium TL4]
QCRMIGSLALKAIGFPIGGFHPIRSRPCWAYTNALTGHPTAVFGTRRRLNRRRSQSGASHAKR